MKHYTTEELELFRNGKMKELKDNVQVYEEFTEPQQTTTRNTKGKNMPFLQRIFHKESSVKSVIPEELSEKNITMENINKALASSYKTVIQPDGSICLCDSTINLNCDFEHKNIRLWIFFYAGDYPKEDLCVFCNEINQSYPFVKISINNDSRFFLRSDCPFLKHLDILQLHRAISSLEKIIAEITKNFPCKAKDKAM